jgi:hypothetical protein
MFRYPVDCFRNSGELVAILRAEKRPPIPDDIVVKLLHESKRTCCVCRDPGQPIIIHHIREWTSSHDHSEENLAVLCLDDHDLAHTTKSLSITLHGDQIRDHKAKWLELVRTQDAKAVLGQANLDGARWDFFNHHRLFELAIAMRVKFQTLRYFRELRRYGMLNETGLIASPATWTVGTPSFRLYDVYEGLYLYFYVKRCIGYGLSFAPGD